MWMKTQWVWLAFAPQCLGASTKKTQRLGGTRLLGLLDSQVPGQAGWLVGRAQLGPSATVPAPTLVVAPALPIRVGGFPEGESQEPEGSCGAYVTESQAPQGVTPSALCRLKPSPAGQDSGEAKDSPSPWWPTRLPWSPLCSALAGREPCQDSPGGAKVDSGHTRWVGLTKRNQRTSAPYLRDCVQAFGVTRQATERGSAPSRPSPASSPSG